MISIYKKEFHQFFSSISGYITITLFLLINGLFLFVLKDSNLFDLGYASLEPFFKLAPWILIFLIPAITMRSMSEEFKTGTFETLKTRPLTSSQIVTGKYLATVTIVAIILILTLVYIFSMQSLSVTGSLDTGGLIGSYLGLLLLSAVFCAIGIACSGITNNPVVAFLVTAFCCLLLYFGCNAISSLPFFQGKLDYYIEMLGIDYHYKSISRGVIDSRDIIYFLSFIFFFLLLAMKNLNKNHNN